jgi:hypothetical protein
MAVTLPNDTVGRLGDAELLELVVEVASSTAQLDALERYGCAHWTGPAAQVITLRAERVERRLVCGGSEYDGVSELARLGSESNRGHAAVAPPRDDPRTFAIGDSGDGSKTGQRRKAQ